MNSLILTMELGAAVLFAAVAMAALRRGRLPFLELVSAAGFGLLLEEGDQLIFGTYHYAADWTLVIDRAPIATALSWALIIAGAMRISDALGVRRRYAAFTDAVLALALDLALEAIAIRLGLWTWIGIGPHDGWFGVPAGNFYAWLWVVFGFSLLTRWLRQAVIRRRGLEWVQLAVPIPAYAVLLVSIVAFGIATRAIDTSPGGGLSLFAIALFGFAVISAWGVWGPNRGSPDGQRLGILDLRLAFAVRLAIYLLYTMALFPTGIASREPVLLAVAVTLLAAEGPLVLLVARRLGIEPRDVPGVGSRAAARLVTKPE